MKNYYSYLIALAFIFSFHNMFAQNTNNSWSFEAGVNYVDVYPVGENAPQGEYFDEFFNLNDHWNLGTYIAVNKAFSDRLSFTTKASFNRLSKWGSLGADESVLVDDLQYYGIDGMININILTESVVKPYIGVGGGYTWIEEGLFNTFSTTAGSKNLVGAGTVNGSVGIKIDITERVGINLQTTYKHTFEDYLTKHFQHSLGAVFKLGKVESKKEDLLDTDGDGVVDAYDLCPDVFGLKIFAGCPDTDGDGIVDSLDKCPNVKGGDNGCPMKVETTTPPTAMMPTEVVSTESVYFNVASSVLDSKAKETLDVVAGNVNNKNHTIIVAGHADSDGSSSSNDILSLKRAKSVKEYLVSKGLTTQSVLLDAYGEDMPAVPNTSRSNKALNRRAELTIKILSNK